MTNTLCGTRGPDSDTKAIAAATNAAEAVYLLLYNARCRAEVDVNVLPCLVDAARHVIECAGDPADQDLLAALRLWLEKNA